MSLNNEPATRLCLSAFQISTLNNNGSFGNEVRFGRDCSVLLELQVGNQSRHSVLEQIRVQSGSTR